MKLQLFWSWEALIILLSLVIASSCPRCFGIKGVITSERVNPTLGLKASSLLRLSHGCVVDRGGTSLLSCSPHTRGAWEVFWLD